MLGWDWLILINKYIQKLKINKKMNMAGLESRVIHATKNDQDENTITLTIPNVNNPSYGCVVKQQVDSSISDFVAFEIEANVAIKPESIMESINIKCIQEGNRFLIPRAEYKLILSEINKDNDQNNRSDNESQSESDLDSASQSQSQSKESQSDDDGSSDQDSALLNCKIEEDQYDSQNAKSLKKGRGRPKGSKNKKTLLKEEQIKAKINHIQQLHFALSGKIKRGKGRPKGSKNKPKVPEAFLKKQVVKQIPQTGKRGKGRPKGSKNKVKASQPPVIIVQNKAKRGRGRPPGTKNKQDSSVDLSSVKIESEQQQQFIYSRAQKTEIERSSCCKRCVSKKIKRDILQGKMLFEDGIDQIDDAFSDESLENRLNLFLQIIKEEDIERLQMLLAKKDHHETYFKPPWHIDGVCQRYNGFEVKTRRDYLSQSGKEGIYALLHDSTYKKNVWWKRVGAERIIESLPNNLIGEEILKMLFAKDSDLKQQVFNNLPTVLRCGNSTVAQFILKQMLQSPFLNKFSFCNEHYDLLTGNVTKLKQHRKISLIKNSDGTNFCSPVHCAAITSETDFLQKLLQHFTDLINVEDSLQRKPIHYASASKNKTNLKTLVQHGAELREIDKRKMTPLMIAAYHGIADNVQFILEKVRQQSYTNFRSDDGYTALHYAILNSHEECVEILLNDSFIRFDSEQKQNGDIFHLVAMTGNSQILGKLLAKWGSALPNCADKFKKTPVMYAIRNHNNEVMYKLLSAGCKNNVTDTSLNSLLHYAAAYGNIEAVAFFKEHIKQTKNKKHYYPWEMAIMKGHLGCAKLLGDHLFSFQQDPLFLLMTNIRGTDEYFECIRYITQKFNFNIKNQDSNNNTYLHMVCAISEEDYTRQRVLESYLGVEQIRQQFNRIQNQLIGHFKDKGLNGYIENKKKESPLKQCIENSNFIGFQKLLTEKISFETQSVEGSTILQMLSNLACKGIDEMNFFQTKLKEVTVNELKVNLKKVDQAGFDFLLYFVKNFTQAIKATFEKKVKKLLTQNKSEEEAEKLAFAEFTAIQSKFMGLVDYLIELGCDMNGQVVDKRTDCSESYQKWGIQHFLMKFPSLKLVKFFKHKIRDFNAENNNGMTPLHLFCKNIKDGNLLSIKHIKIDEDYEAENIIQYLLTNGLNPNTIDSTKSLPILYAALNCQFKFIMILLKHKSEINQVNSKNQVVFIEIIKNHSHYSFSEIEQLLKKGAKPQFEDMDKRNALHHLVACSSNFDSSPEIFKLLLNHKVKINSLDKYGRSPIFYCFDPDDLESGEPNDKVELLQVMVNLVDINLNLLDLFKRSVVHYACRKNYFFSILYLLDKNINMQIVDHEENTPLAICLRHRNLYQAAFIIRKGVRYGFVNDLTAKEPDRRMSYFAYAIKNLSVGICFMLLDYGYPIQKALEQVPNDVFRQQLKMKYIK